MHIYIYIRVFLLKCCDYLILIVSTLTFSSSCFYIIHFFIIYLLLVPKFFFFTQHKHYHPLFELSIVVDTYWIVSKQERCHAAKEEETRVVAAC